MRIVIVICLLFSVSLTFAQNDPFERFYVGGGGGFSFGSNSTNVSLSPYLGYKVTDRLSAGVGISYQYVKVKSPSVSFNNFGWSVFSRYNLTEQFFFHSEFERLNFQFLTSVSPERKSREGYNSLLLGAGYGEPIGRNSSFSITVLYNVLYDEAKSPRPYNSPFVIRGGLNFGMFSY